MVGHSAGLGLAHRSKVGHFKLLLGPRKLKEQDRLILKTRWKAANQETHQDKTPNVLFTY
jgi:hypothetical protein